MNDDISQEMREEARRLSEAISSQLTDAQRATVLPVAAEVAEAMVSILESKEKAIRMASVMAQIFSLISLSKVGDVSDTIDTYLTSYSLATGVLSGAIQVEGVPAPAPAPEKPREANQIMPHRTLGMYL